MTSAAFEINFVGSLFDLFLAWFLLGIRIFPLCWIQPLRWHVCLLSDRHRVRPSRGTPKSSMQLRRKTSPLPLPFVPPLPVRVSGEAVVLGAV
jgi:hypothetical protein